MSGVVIQAELEADRDYFTDALEAHYADAFSYFRLAVQSSLPGDTLSGAHYVRGWASQSAEKDRLAQYARRRLEGMPDPVRELAQGVAT